MRSRSKGWLGSVLVGAFLLSSIVGVAFAESYKGFLAVWRPGSDAMYWRTGMDLEEFKAQDAEYFAQGLRITSIDVFRYTGFGDLSYTAVWRPGSGGQRWRSGMSIEEFKAQEAQYIKEGWRIAAFDIQSGEVFAVWRPGTGVEKWWTGISSAELKDREAEYRAQGLRIVVLVQHGSNDFAAVWRPGSGSQLWATGMSFDQFAAQDTIHFKQGFRLASLDAYGGEYMAVWRNDLGGGAQFWKVGLELGTLQQKIAEHFNAGRRLVILRAKHFQR